MKQSSLRYLGALDLLLVAALLVAFGPQVAVVSPVPVMMAVAGLCALLAGSVAAVSVGPATVTWRHLVGTAYAAFALMWPATYGPAVLAGTATGEELALAVVTTVGGSTLLFVGYDIARGGRHFDITTDVERVVGR